MKVNEPASPREGPWTVFDFTASRATEGPRDFLGGFSGRVACDAYAVYGTDGTLITTGHRYARIRR